MRGNGGLPRAKWKVFWVDREDEPALQSRAFSGEQKARDFFERLHSKTFPGLFFRDRLVAGYVDAWRDDLLRPAEREEEVVVEPPRKRVYVPGGVDPGEDVFEAFHAPAFRRHGGPGQSGVENPYRENRGGSLESAYARARALYRKFYKLEPRGERLANLTIPEEVFHVGSAKQVLYRSDKLNPTTLEDEGIIDYFHDHNAGVKAFLAKSDAGRLVKVPTRVIHTPVLVVLGKCLGFTFETEEGELEGKGKKPLPELCALPPNGSVLLVVQNRRTVLAMMWGGRLTVKPEGITG